MDSKENNIQKFLALDQKKRDRIINAAMKEFRYGFKKASTDAIVKDAGISKGLLFHYFGTKERLYAFLLDHLMEKEQKEYYEMIDNNPTQDILEGLWQAALLKKDITSRYPYIFEFASGAFIHVQDAPEEKIFHDLWKKHERIESEIYSQFDVGLIRDDVDPIKAFDIITYVINGFTEFSNAKYGAAEDEDDYGKFLEELHSYLDILRLCFYKN